MHGVTSVETNIKWNNAASDFFRPSRGIHQGDPISPYIFVLCLDKLSHLIRQSVHRDDWKSNNAGNTWACNITSHVRRRAPAVWGGNN